MDFDLATARPLLERRPATFAALLEGVPEAWTQGNEGPGTWSVNEVLAHLIHAEHADWIPRVRHLLERGEREPFPPFNRTYGLAESRARRLTDLVAEFALRRRESLAALDALGLTTDDLARVGRHPEFGRVTLAQHLATWVAHDLTHLVQIVRVMAVQYREAVGPWSAYLRVVRPV